MSNAPAIDLANHRILLTGTTGSIGRIAAQKLAEAGAHVVLNGRDPAKLEHTAATLPAGSHTIAAFDLNDGDGIAGWMRGLAEKDGPFHGLVHTAASQVTIGLRAINADVINKMLHVNVTSAIMLGKAFRQRACHADGASLVLMGSTAAFIGGAGNVPYAASKGAVMAVSKAMAHELLRDKIRVNCIVSGLIESDMSMKSQAGVSSETWNRVLSGYPMGLGKPQDIAYAIIYLLSDQTRWMTGTELQIDGALSIA